MNDSKTYDCPGIAMDQPAGAPHEGYVACYKAGHECPPKERIRKESDGFVTVSYRCPCCGDGGTSFGMPVEWEPDFDQRMADRVARQWDEVRP